MSNNEKQKDFRDILQSDGINAKGFGIIAKMVMLDRKLTIEAKAIYSYFCSYAGAGNTAFPSVTKICDDLCISEDRYYRHFPLLRAYGYITVVQHKKDGQYSHNVYTLVSNPIPDMELIQELNEKKTQKKAKRSQSNIPYPQNKGAEKPSPQIPGTENASPENTGSKMNSSSPKNNRSKTLIKSISQSTDRPTDEMYNLAEETELQNIIAKSELNHLAVIEKYTSLIDSAQEAIREMYYTKEMTVKDGKITQSGIRSTMAKINYFSMGHALEKFIEASKVQKINHPVEYLKRCIYTAVYEEPVHTQAEVNFALNS